MRGLPTVDQLNVPHTARFFREALVHNYVTEETMGSEEDKKTLNLCFKLGWLHAIESGLQDRYIFATPLHRWFVDYYLGTRPSDAALITEDDLPTFAINVVRHFSSRKLSSPREVGPSSLQRPLEAQFQDEFYRCSHQHSKGSLISFPEFGSAIERIEFFIHHRKWGVELLRDGDRLEAHSSRFIAPGAYASMNLSDYIILDFCTTRPQKAHPG